MPNPEMNKADDAIVSDINVMHFIYDNENDVLAPPPFNYYKYMGSKTSPPCEESVVWFVVEKTH
jgi:carbonic anhydrase